jgi:peptide/nickel transport system substrate-binding protein
MKPKFAKQLIFVTALAVIMVVGAVSLNSAHADIRSNFVVAVQKIPPVMEPMRVNSNVHMRILYNIGETLIKIDYKNNRQLVPGLAEMTAEDVAFSFGEERLFHKKRGWTFAQMYLGDINPPEVVDRYTVRISSKRTDYLLEKRFASYMSEIINKKAFLEAKDWESWSRSIVCTGPYKLVEIKAGDYIKLEAFDDYWGTKAPVKTITFKVVPEVAARIAGLKTGEYHIITEIPPDQLESIDKHKGTSSLGGAIPNIRAVHMDTTNEVLKNGELRQALIMAVDRQLIVDSLYHGRTTVPNGFQLKMSGDMWIEDYRGLSYNPDKARELVKKSGYKGETIYYRVQPDYYTMEIATGEILIEMWKAVGLNVKMEMKENWSQVLKNDETRHIINMSHTAFYSDPEGILWRRLGPKSPFRYENIYGAKAPFCYVPEEFDKWGQDLIGSTDLAKRRNAVRHMLEIVDAEGFLISLHALPMFYGKRDEVDWAPYQAEYMDLTATNLGFK